MTENMKPVAMWSQRLKEAASLLEDLPEAKPWYKELQALEQRLSENAQLVAVFGAFSAGKSSLINALLKEQLLVVSPNPTTAAITRISQQGPSETPMVAKVAAKTQEQVWDDVQQAFAGLHRPVPDFSAALREAQGLKPADFAPAARKAVSFLKAVAQGFPDMQDRIGTEWTVDGEAWKKLTSEERQACFVQHVDIQLPGKALGKGLVLVDTPGVDSIHQRHTEVAFNYMRRADAIVFVLYYTHAFSRADKDFLLQLAGVQDVVGQDKLFVVINAVDLAKTPDEQEQVHERVVRELKGLGIHRPRVFDISSQLAFAADKLATDPTDPRMEQLVRQRLRLSSEAQIPALEHLAEISGLDAFREVLLHHLSMQGEQLAVNAAVRLLKEVSDGVHSVFSEKQEQSQMDAAAKEELDSRRSDFLNELKDMAQTVEMGKSQTESALQMEWDELVFHAGERIRLRFSALVREAFHPGRFRTPNPRQALSDALDELKTTVVRQVELECRTFALRAQVQAAKAFQAWSEPIALRLQTLKLASLNARVSQTEPDFAGESLRAQLTAERYTSSFRHFSSAKQFFEGEGQARLLEDLEQSLLQDARSEVSHLTNQVRAFAVQWLREQELRFASELVESIQEFQSAGQRLEGESQLALWERANRWFESSFVS